MIVNNSSYQLLMEIPLDLIPNILLGIGIGILIILGLILRINSTKSFLKALFHRYILLILLLSTIWSIIIFMTFGNCLMKYYSAVTIVLTIIFSIMILCITSHKWASDDSFLKNMFIDNFKINTIFCVFVGLIPQIFTFDLWIYILEFVRSLFLPLVIEILFLPLIYGIAVLNEYREIRYISSNSTKDIMIYDVLKKCNINLWCIHKLNKQLNYKISNNLEFVMDNKKESEFKLINNEIYIGDELIGRYECNVELPKTSRKMSEAYTIEKNIYYIIGDYELENLSGKNAFIYFRYKNMNIKLFIETKYAPMHIWSPLIEDIYKFELL